MVFQGEMDYEDKLDLMERLAKFFLILICDYIRDTFV